MKKKRRLSLILFGISAIIFLIILIVPYFFDSPKRITGRGITASVALLVEGAEDYVNITSPLNITYNFSIGDNYFFELNVTSTTPIINWSFNLTDLRHDLVINSTTLFTPNITFKAVRWSNTIAIQASGLSGSTLRDEVTFYVDVPNSAPIIYPSNTTFYVCEGDAFSSYFTIYDADEQILEFNLAPTDPFYIFPLYYSGNVPSTLLLFSGILNYDDVGNYTESMSISDGILSDTRVMNITVLEINDAPAMNNIGVQTVYTRGENNTFYNQVSVDDEESGNQNLGNLDFSIDFLNSIDLFNISSTGIMNFTPNSSQVGIYNISVCVEDQALASPHQNISLCGQDGSSIKVCQNFSLTVTNENRAPTITDYNPTNLSLSVSGTDSLIFNITKYDPDYTTPDTYWYVDSSLNEYDSGSSIDTLIYSFGCGVSGPHSIKAEITDGLLNDSVTWSVDVSNVVCPIISAGGGGAGGGGGSRSKLSCLEKWTCDNWNVCQNTEKSLEEGVLSREDYRVIKEDCIQEGFDEGNCGVQIRSCLDFAFCNSSYLRPSLFQSCHYTEKPSCEDKIKNCHDGSCEVLVDCGGPCNTCSSCSDGAKNQGEEGIDCGGPCPWKCPVEKPFEVKPWIIVSLGVTLGILLIIGVLRILRLYKLKKVPISK